MRARGLISHVRNTPPRCETSPLAQGLLGERVSARQLIAALKDHELIGAHGGNPVLDDNGFFSDSPWRFDGETDFIKLALITDMLRMFTTLSVAPAAPIEHGAHQLFANLDANDPSRARTGFLFQWSNHDEAAKFAERALNFFGPSARDRRRRAFAGQLVTRSPSATGTGGDTAACYASKFELAWPPFFAFELVTWPSRPSSRSTRTMSFTRTSDVHEDLGPAGPRQLAESPEEALDRSHLADTAQSITPILASRGVTPVGDDPGYLNMATIDEATLDGLDEICPLASSRHSPAVASYSSVR
jgi:hypothetical protein